MEYEIGKKHGLDKEQVDGLKSLAVNIAGRAVKKFLIDYVNYVAENAGLESTDRQTIKKSPELSARLAAYKKLIGKLDKLPMPDQSWCMQFEIQDVDEFMLCYQVAIVQKDNFEITIHVPKEQHPRFMFELDNLTKLARNYYITTISQSGIKSDLAALLPDVDISDLRINQFNRTLYLDEEYKKRIGIICYYVDKEGKPVELVDQKGNPIIIPECEK